MKLAIDSDINGLDLKKDICVFLKGKGIDFTDLSFLDKNPELDYPDVAFNLAFQIKNKKYERGILICGTGQGMAICANKVQGVYAGACSDEYSAERLRKSNNAQIITLGAYVVGVKLALRIIEVWLSSEFNGGGSLKKVNRLRDFEAGKIT